MFNNTKNFRKYKQPTKTSVQNINAVVRIKVNKFIKLSLIVNK